MKLKDIARSTAALTIAIIVLFSYANGMETVDSESGRFVVLETFHGHAVFDHTTHLIWERFPHSAEVTWSTATARCALKAVDGQPGWRLPSFFELMTLVEPAIRPTTSLPALPPSHPFQGIAARAYWTNDTHATDSTQAYTVDFLRADLVPHQKIQPHPIWCVRGGMTDQPQPSSVVKPHDLI